MDKLKVAKKLAWFDVQERPEYKNKDLEEVWALVLKEGTDDLYLADAIELLAYLAEEGMVLLDTKKLTIMNDDEIGNIEWESATLDMSFVDDYKSEVKALLEAQLNHTRKQIAGFKKVIEIKKG